MSELHVVTGALGFSGRHIAQQLLDRGLGVRTITGHPHRPNPFGNRIKVPPFAFDRPDALAESLRSATTLYNTYWIRFEYHDETFERAVKDSVALIRAAERAGVRRIVYVSITNPDEGSPPPYFRGKAIVERAIRESSLSHAILRPAVLFGHGDVLINNIAWLLRRLPVFAVPGSGEYGLRPIHVDDLASLAVREGTAADAANSTIDAVGLEQVTFNQLVTMLKNAVKSRSLVVHLPPRIALAFSRIAGAAVRDVMLTGDEVDGLLAGLLESPGPAAGSIRLSDWLRDNGDSIGRRYASEVARHYR